MITLIDEREALRISGVEDALHGGTGTNKNEARNGLQTEPGVIEIGPMQMLRLMEELDERRDPMRKNELLGPEASTPC